MSQYHQSLGQSSWSAQDRLLTGMLPPQTDRSLSQLAADRYALHEAVKQQRQQLRASRQHRRLWTWRSARRAEAKPA